VKKALRKQAIGVVMFTRSLSALACVLATGAVLAQGASPRPVPPKPILGKAIEVKGLVTVSDESGVSRVVVNNAVIDRSRFVTSSSGSARLRLDNGCDILLKPSQALTIEHEQPCDALWASIESLGNPSGLLLASGVSSASLIPFAVGGAIMLLSGSGGNGGSGAAGPGGSGGNTPGGPPDDGAGGSIPTPPHISPE
jgi:hypothetical protein